MTDQQSLIEVFESIEEDVAATGADLRITISGARYFAGEAALQQAQEVRRVIDALVAAGIAETDIGIASVRVDTTKGVVLRSSSATYQLAVRCRDTALVAGAIDATSGQKNLVLNQVIWRYDVAESWRHTWLARAVKQAKAAADAMADAAGKTVSHPHRIVDETHGPSSDRNWRGSVPGAGSDDGYGLASKMRRRVVDALENLELAPKQTQVVKVRAWFVIT